MRPVIPILFILLFLVPVTGLYAQTSLEEEILGEVEEELKKDTEDKDAALVSDPLMPVNRVMYVINDRLYLWVMEPAAKGYKKVVPQPARIGVANFFHNLGTPVRMLNCVLQGKGESACVEFTRFTLNTVFGVAGFMDVARTNPKLSPPPDEDMGQTFAVWGMGNGWYLVLPFFGPSTFRDAAGMGGDYYADPRSAIDDTLVSAGLSALDTINVLSFRIGDYQSLKKAAIDPYIAIRNAYIQNRIKKIKE